VVPGGDAGAGSPRRLALQAVQTRGCHVYQLNPTCTRQNSSDKGVLIVGAGNE
jgi:hypothetical protein